METKIYTKEVCVRLGRREDGRERRRVFYLYRFLFSACREESKQRESRKKNKKQFIAECVILYRI